MKDDSAGNLHWLYRPKDCCTFSRVWRFSHTPTPRCAESNPKFKSKQFSCSYRQNEGETPTEDDRSGVVGCRGTKQTNCKVRCSFVSSVLFSCGYVDLFCGVRRTDPLNHTNKTKHGHLKRVKSFK